VQARIAPRLLEDPTNRKTLMLTGYLGRKDAGKMVSVPGLNDSFLYTPAMTASMILSIALMDGKLGTRPRAAIDTLMEFPPSRWSPDDPHTWKLVDFYYWCHATYALLAGVGPEDPRWARWSEALGKALGETQHAKSGKAECLEGSWDPADRWACEGGRGYATATAALTLEVQRRLPRILAAPKSGRTLAADLR
jgi:hypothetical protein